MAGRSSISGTKNPAPTGSGAKSWEETPRVICSVESLRHFGPAGCGYSHTAPREGVTERSDGGRHPCESFARVETGGTGKDGKQRTEKAPLQPEAGPRL